MDKHRHRIRLPDGTIRLLGDQEPLPIGATFVVPLALRDSSTLRDAATTDADRADAAHREMIADLSTAWESPQASARRGLEPEWSTLSPSQRERETAAAWEAMKADLSTAWEGRPPVPVGSLQAGSLQATQVAAYAPHTSGFEPSARDQYIAELTNAWRHPTGSY